ncbi:MAG: amino acid permease [Sphingomonadales bacterium]
MANGNAGGKLRRGIATAGISLLVLNGMIGAGIFALPGALAEAAGALSPWLFLLTGAVFLAVVLTFAELASYFRGTGGPVLYTYTAFGPFAGFQVGWLLYTARITALGANANVMISYLAHLWPGVGEGALRAGLILLLIGGLVWANIRGIKEGIRTMGLLTIFKLLPLLGLILLGLSHIDFTAGLSAGLPEGDELGGTALLLIYAFVGFEGALVVAGETGRPRRTLPRALIPTVLGITLFYFLIQLVYVSVVPAGEISDAPLIEAGRALAGPIGALAITLAAVFSIAGNLSQLVLTAPRMTYALAEEGSLPKWFGRIHPRYATPHNSLLFLGVVGGLLAVTGSFVWLATVSALARMIAYSFSILALPVIRKKASAEDRARAFRLPGGLVIPVIGLVLCLWVASNSTPAAWGVLALLVAGGSILYFGERFFKAG